VILKDLPKGLDPRLIVGFETGDDAAVILIRDDLTVVQSLDFFMPIVDDPFTFGQIAAANAISDIYAMGAQPIVALAILGYPTKLLSPEVARQIMLGGSDICQKAGIQIAGGHSIDDTEPKFGLSVTGVAHPNDLWQNSTAKEGDLLVLTKPLGVGTMGSANKKGLLSPEQYASFVKTTTFLNDKPADVARDVGVSAATDVTGFGLLGHSLEMAKGAGLQLQLWSNELPILPGALDLILNGVIPGATGRNLNHVEPVTDYAENVEPHLKAIMADPQTSGGLLFAVPPQNVERILEGLSKKGALCGAVVGRFQKGQGLVVQ
jgi:selenide, water dikinase